MHSPCRYSAAHCPFLLPNPDPLPLCSARERYRVLLRNLQDPREARIVVLEAERRVDAAAAGRDGVVGQVLELDVEVGEEGGGHRRRPHALRTTRGQRTSSLGYPC